MPTSTNYTNCTFFESSFYEVYDDPNKPLNTTRWSLNYTSGGGNQQFNAINKWTQIPGVGNYSNIEQGYQIPKSDKKGLRFTTS